MASNLNLRKNGSTSQPQAQPQAQQENLWERKFNALCYEVFHRNEQGKELLNHLEMRYFRSPVAFPNMEPSWAFFNEGKNELIRSFTNAIQLHLNQSNNQK